ncbi:uncharacterized protein RBU33_014405 isoform 2-T2 [Hipposideros larvatus]
MEPLEGSREPIGWGCLPGKWEPLEVFEHLFSAQRSSLGMNGQNPDLATIWLPTFSSCNGLLTAAVETPLSPQFLFGWGFHARPRLTFHLSGSTENDSHPCHRFKDSVFSTAHISSPLLPASQKNMCSLRREPPPCLREPDSGSDCQIFDTFWRTNLKSTQ